MNIFKTSGMNSKMRNYNNLKNISIQEMNALNYILIMLSTPLPDMDSDQRSIYGKHETNSSGKYHINILKTSENLPLLSHQ